MNLHLSSRGMCCKHSNLMTCSKLRASWHTRAAVRASFSLRAVAASILAKYSAISWQGWRYCTPSAAPSLRERHHPAAVRGGHPSGHQDLGRDPSLLFLLIKTQMTVRCWVRRFAAIVICHHGQREEWEDCRANSNYAHLDCQKEEQATQATYTLLS